MLGLQAMTCRVHFAVVVVSVVPLPDRKLPGVLVLFVCRLPRSRRTLYSPLCCEKELYKGEGRWRERADTANKIKMQANSFITRVYIECVPVYLTIHNAMMNS